MRLIIPTLLATLVPLAVSAADLSNRDSQSYDMKIHNGGTTHTSISGNTTRSSVCTECKLEIIGVGTIEVSSSDSRILIKDGTLSRE